MASKQYDEGYKAFEDGFCVSVNPYVKTNTSLSLDNAWFQWRRGYFNSREDLFDQILNTEQIIREEMYNFYNLQLKANGKSNGLQS